MKGLRSISCGLIAGVIVLTFSNLAIAQSQSQSTAIADNESIFIDGKTFTITPGKAKGDAGPRIQASGAQALGPGAVIFRSNQTLYIMDAPLLLRSNDRAARAGADGWRPNRILIDYDPPKKDDKHYDEEQKLYDRIKEHRVLETMQHIFSPFRLPADLVIKTTGCDGMINSWYSRSENPVPTVTMCYELLLDIMRNVPKETTPNGVTPADAISGQFFFWVAHEMGHAVYDLYQVPLFGRSEDAADAFAGFIMLQFGKDQARRLVGGAAYAANELNLDFAKNPTVQKNLEKYSAVHGLPEQRFYNLLCLAYGADAKVFADLVEKGYLPKRRADNCENEYQTFKRAFQNQIVPHIDRQMARAVLDMNWLPQSSAQAIPR